MMDFLLYDGKVAAALLVFYLFYRFLLKKETFHRFNRVVLVGTAVLSFLLPLCIITIHKPIEAGPVVPEPMDLTAQELAPMAETASPWWPVALAILFWTGVVFVLARVIISILSILKIIRRSQLVREEDGCKIIVTERDIDPFSWMKYIVLSIKDWEARQESILAHEKAHIGMKHSREILLVDVLSALQWFNPAIWMLRADLQELHEYEADDAVLRSGANIKEYQYLLIRKAVSKSGYSVANSFNHSILKNRITMMSKSKSPLSRGLRVLWMLPLVCLAIGLQAQTVYVPADKGNEKNLNVTQDTPILLNIRSDGKIESGGQVYSIDQLKDIIPTHEAGQPLTPVQINAADDVRIGVISDVKNELRKLGALKVFYTSASDNTVIIRPDDASPLFILRQMNEDKAITKAEFAKIEKERIKSIEVLKDDAAKEKYGDEAAAHGVIVVTLKRPQELNEIVVVSHSDDDDAPIPFMLANPETMPSFQGEGTEAFSRWLIARIVRPKGCKHSGTMKVSFVVASDGSVKDVKILESVCAELDDLVLSIISKSPKWEPATNKGTPVAQCLSIPISFRIQ